MTLLHTLAMLISIIVMVTDTLAMLVVRSVAALVVLECAGDVVDFFVWLGSTDVELLVGCSLGSCGAGFHVARVIGWSGGCAEGEGCDEELSELHCEDFLVLGSCFEVMLWRCVQDL